MAKLICPIQNKGMEIVSGIYIQQRPKVSQKFGNYYNGTYKRIGYSMGHPGIDIAVPIGTPVFSPLRGIVRHVPADQGYGLGCYIHNGSLEVLVNHFSKIFVKDGQRVMEGDIIGETGNTGRSSGPHLHLGFRKYKKDQKYNEGWIDPLPHFVTWKGNLELNNL